MNTAIVKQIADAVMYEGYLLYPYRPSVKNRQRWTFGGLYPEAYTIAHGETEPCSMRTECLISGNSNAMLDVQVRFLHLQQRGGKGDSWQEAVERTVDVENISLDELVARPRQQAFSFPASQQCENDGQVRDQEGVSGTVEISSTFLEPGRFRLAAVIHNRTPLEDAANRNRDEALLCSFVSTHTILGIRDGEFVSLIDPPEDWRELASTCKNVGAWPVLAGEEGQRDTILSSPIILYDYPRVAAESPGDLFDGTEIDEILSLRILTLTGEEKRAAAADERAHALLERTEALAREQLMGLHGVMRPAREERA